MHLNNDKIIGVHETANAYQKVAQAFDRGRPEYTQASIQTLVHNLRVQAHSRVLDLGAGTGKFTKHLYSFCSNLCAVEPISSMRESLAKNLPSIEILEGSAESIPLPDQSIDTVFVANAFHWFDAPKALAEIRRVLKDGGGLGLIWINDGVFTSEWGEEINQMLAPYESLAPQRKSGEWQNAFEPPNFFSPLQSSELSHVREATPELILDRVASLSFVAALNESKNKRLLAQVKELLEVHPLTRGQPVLKIECTTDVFWTFRRN